MGRYIFLLALFFCATTSFAQPALADTSKLYFHDGKFSWRANLSTLKTYVGIPLTLGTALQELRVNSGGTALEYYTPSGGGGGDVATDAIWDAKGDLAVGTGANTAIKLTVGADGKPLFSDAAESTGLRWGNYAISPSQITSDQNDYSPTGWAKAQIINISGDNGIRAITSFAATFDGDTKTIFNTGEFALYIPAMHPSGTSGNRVFGYCDYILFGKCAVDIVYDGTRSGWRIKTPIAWQIPQKTSFYSWGYGSTTGGDWGFADFSNSGTGSSQSSTDASTGIPGHILMSTGTTTTGSSRITLTKSAFHYSIFGDAHLWSDFMVSVPALSDGTETFTVLLTIDDTGNNTSLNNNSVGFRYTHGTNSGKWQGFSRNNSGSETTVDTGIAVAVSTIYKLRVEINKARTEARFYINGEMTGVVTGNMPNALSIATRMIIIKSAGTTGRTLRAHTMSAGAIYP